MLKFGRDRILLFAVSALLLAGVAGAQSAPGSEGASLGEPGASFAGLIISAAGEQRFDVTTGVTTLPGGGSITDRATGVRVDADEIEYLPGAYVTAAGVRVEGDFGVVTAGALRIDLETDVLSVEGPLELTREGLAVRAGELTYDARAGIAVFAGGVEGNDPTFRTDRLLLDALSGDALLVGEYEYHDALFVMESPVGGGMLELRFAPRGDEPAYEVATEVSEGLLERFEDYL